jgi:hypothetical protein
MEFYNQIKKMVSFLCRLSIFLTQSNKHKRLVINHLKFIKYIIKVWFRNKYC